MATSTIIGNVVTAVINRISDIEKAIGEATSTASGLMSAAQAKKLGGIAAGANKTTIANNLTTQTAGMALDATQGYALATKMTDIAVVKIKQKVVTVDTTATKFTMEPNAVSGYTCVYGTMYHSYALAVIGGFESYDPSTQTAVGFLQSNAGKSLDVTLYGEFLYIKNELL